MATTFSYSLKKNRLIPKIIGYLFMQRFKTQITFGRVSLPFTLRAVKIIKNGFSIVSELACVCVYSIAIVTVLICLIYSILMKLRFEAVSLIRKSVNWCRLLFVTFVSIRTSMTSLPPTRVEIEPMTLNLLIRI